MREHAEAPVERVFLLWTEQLCLGVVQSPERAGPPGENGPEPLPVQVAARKPRSAAWIGKRLGVSRAMANYLMRGAPKLRPEHLPGLALTFAFSPEELAYVEGMIRLARATDLAERAWMRRSPIAYAVAHGTRTWEGEAYRVAAHWAPPAIHALAHLSGFRDDPAWISAALGGRICEADVDDLVRALIEAGMLAPQAGGPLRPATPTTMNPPDVHDLERFARHDTFLCLAQNELRLPGALPPLTAWIVALPEAAIPALRARLDAHKDQILGHLQASDARPGPQDRVLMVGLQLRPLTHLLVPSLAPRTRRR